MSRKTNLISPLVLPFSKLFNSWKQPKCQCECVYVVNMCLSASGADNKRKNREKQDEKKATWMEPTTIETSV